MCEELSYANFNLIGVNFIPSRLRELTQLPLVSIIEHKEDNKKIKKNPPRFGLAAIYVVDRNNNIESILCSVEEYCDILLKHKGAITATNLHEINISIFTSSKKFSISEELIKKMALLDASFCVINLP